MRGYFGIGIDGATKPGNVGNLIRTAHAFGAKFTFLVKPILRDRLGEQTLDDFGDTAKTPDALPFYVYDHANKIERPKGCQIVGIELTDDAIDLPSFRHPARAVYLLGGERLGLSEDCQAVCDHMIKIPTQFSLNVATAGAIVMYDRMRMLGGFPERPVMAGRTPDERPSHTHGAPILRRFKDKKQGDPA